MKRIKHSTFAAIVAAIAMAGLSASVARAQVYWDGEDANNSLYDANNWVGNVLPTSTDDAVLDDSVTTITGDLGLDGPIGVNSLTIDSPGMTGLNASTSPVSNRTLSLSNLTVGDNANSDLHVGSANGALTIQMVGDTTLDIAAGKTVTVDARVIDGSDNAAQLIKTGPGTVIFTNQSNAWGGDSGVGKGLIINEGTVSYTGNQKAIAVPDNADITMNGGELHPIGVGFGAGGAWHMVIGPSAVATLNVDASQTFSGNIAAIPTDSTFVKIGLGGVRFGGDQSNIDGTVRIDEGYLEVNPSATALGDTTNPATVVLNGGTFYFFNHKADISYYANVTVGADATISWDGGATVFGITSGFDGGTLTLNGDRTLTVAAPAATAPGSTIGATFTGPAVFNGSETFNVTNSYADANSVASTLTLAGDISEDTPGRGLIKTGDGTLVLTGNLGYTGDTTVEGGTLSYAGDLADGSTVSIADGTVLDLEFSGADTVGQLIINGSPVGPGIYNASNATYGSYFAGTGSLQIVPEPATLALLTMGGLALIQRKRRRVRK